MLSRRAVLKRAGAIGAAGLVGSIATGSVSADTHVDSFVETQGTEFVVDGDPVYFNGSNNFWITDDYSGSEQRIDDVFSLFEDLGINVVRMWAHGENKEGPLTLQPEPGEHNEEALQLHDYAVHAAAEHGIRLIVCLVDNWSHEGGMAQYAAWVTGDDYDRENYDLSTGLHEVFYTDDEAQELYRNHVETMVTRENTYNGLEWREDPTIMMWELANEPRLQRDWSYDGDNFQGDEHKQILGDWIQESAAFVKSLDSNHLVSTGSEGHYYGEWGNEFPRDDYPYGEWDGQDYVEHHSYDDIDAASFHWYPDHWFGHLVDGPDELPLDHGSEWIREHVEDAHQELGKPAYLGEFNISSQDHDLQTRNQHFEDYYATADEVDCNAVLVWQVVLDDTDDHDGFQVYRDESGYIIENYADVVAEKSGDGGVEPGNPPSFDGYQPQDTTGDGLANDLTGSGSTTTTDVNVFFENVENPAVADYPEYYDFDGNGAVSISDVVELFESL